MSIENLNFADIILAVVVILILMGVYNTAMATIKNYRSEVKSKREPIDAINRRLEEHDRFFTADKRRIDKLEETALANARENRMMIRMQLALVRHSIDGNNIDDLRKQRDEVQDYLIEKC